MNVYTFGVRAVGGFLAANVLVPDGLEGMSGLISGTWSAATDPTALLLRCAGMIPIALGLALRAASRELDHPARRRIYEHLLLLPGDHFRSIARTLGLGIGDARHHLSVLLRQKLVREEKRSGRCRYYADGRDSETERNLLFGKHWRYRDLRIRILNLVRSNGGVRPATVASALGISRQLAAYHLTRLVELGLIHRAGGRYRA